MGSIPLVANGIRTPEQPDLMAKYGQLMQLKNAQQQSQMMQQEAPLRLQQLQQGVQQGGIQLQQAQQGQQDQQSFRTAMQDPSMQGKTIGQIADALAQKGQISQAGWATAKKADLDHQETVQKLDTGALANAAAAHKQTQEIYDNVMNMPDDQLAANWPQIAQQVNAIPGNKQTQLNPNQPMTKQQLSQFGPMLSMGNSYLDQELARRKAATDAKTAEATLGEKQAAAKFYQENGGAPGVPVEAIQQADWLKKNPGKGPSDYVAWKAKQSPMALVMGNMLQGPGLDLAAQNYLQTGQMIPEMTRSPGTVKAVADRAAAMNQEQNGQGIAANTASYRADRASLAKLQTFSDSVSAFEQTAEKNMDLLQSTAKDIPQLGTKFANTPVRMLNADMIGTANMAKFHTALNVAQTEAAKVLNNPSSSAVLSDSARKDLQELINGNMTYPAMVGSLDTLKQDMKNRTASNNAAIKTIQDRIKGPGSSTPSNASPQQGGNDPFAQFGGKAH
jgi:hypothetical protein